ncbi:MAG: polysaccharide deacetylase family protein, partial [Actinobacteria bacterium]|nr:polysaccharide deacetylase family protein [Actinomycetota bacterium]
MRPEHLVGRVALVLGLAFVAILIWTGVASAASATVIYHGSKERKQIALTFDDNTNVPRALGVLRALAHNEVRATLVVTGNSVQAFPAINTEIVKGMAAGLFEVGDHSRSHPVLTGLSRSGMASQIGAGTDAFRRLTGARTVPLYRFP